MPALKRFLPYFIDSQERIGILHDVLTGRCQYAYGLGAYPRSKTNQLTELDEVTAKHRLDAQREQMWVDVIRFEKLAKRLARRASNNPADAEALYSDVGLPMLCYAVVMHVAKKSPIENYVSQALGQAYSHAMQRTSTTNQQEEIYDLENLQENCQQVALIAKDELYTLGLSADEMSLLLSRYDSEQSFDAIAIELGMWSRGTPKARIDKIIKRCRNQSKSWTASD